MKFLFGKKAPKPQGDQPKRQPFQLTPAYSPVRDVIEDEVCEIERQVIQEYARYAI